MTTLYDLLGALPGDDADDLRDAFRQAVKGVHPDIRPNDPEAALNFRLIVYAMEVLRDPEQRAAYDHLLEQARQELLSQHRAAKLRNFAFAMLGLAGATVVAVGMSILFAPTSAVLAPAAERLADRPAVHDDNTAASGDADATRPEPQSDFLTRWGANDIYAKAAQPADIAKPVPDQNELPPPPIVDDASAPAERAAETAMVMKEAPVEPPAAAEPPAPPDTAAHITARVEADTGTDAGAVMHARGVAAYRNGDLKLALADFSRAIELNPTFMLAYVNRGIVLYRMGNLDRALADVARARRLDRAGHAGSVAAVHRKRRRNASLLESAAFMQAAGL